MPRRKQFFPQKRPCSDDNPDDQTDCSEQPTVASTSGEKMTGVDQKNGYHHHNQKVTTTGQAEKRIKIEPSDVLDLSVKPGEKQETPRSSESKLPTKAKTSTVSKPPNPKVSTSPSEVKTVSSVEPATTPSVYIPSSVTFPPMLPPHLMFYPWQNPFLTTGSTIMPSVPPPLPYMGAPYATASVHGGGVKSKEKPTNCDVSKKPKPTVEESPSFSSTLDKLSSLVHTVGTASEVGSKPIPVHPEGMIGGTIMDPQMPSADGPNGMSFQELWWKYVKKEENAEMKRLNEAKRIFTCLQCQASFETMDQLVKHMEMTKHFNNVPKHYSWSLQYARQRMRQMRVKMKYSDRMMYFCLLCHQPFNESVHNHFSTIHEMHNPAENMNFVQVISVGEDGKEHFSSINSLKLDSPGDSSSVTSKQTSSPTPSQHSRQSAQSPPVLSMNGDMCQETPLKSSFRSINKISSDTSKVVVSSTSPLAHLHKLACSQNK